MGSRPTDPVQTRRKRPFPHWQRRRGRCGLPCCLPHRCTRRSSPGCSGGAPRRRAGPSVLVGCGLWFPYSSRVPPGGIAFQHAQPLRASLVSTSACQLFGLWWTLAGGPMVLQIGLTRKFCSCGGDELVEGGFWELAFTERLLAGVCEFFGFAIGYEGDRASTESCAGETGARGTVYFCRFYEGVELGGRDFVVVAQGSVRSVHQAAELVEIVVC